MTTVQPASTRSAAFFSISSKRLSALNTASLDPDQRAALEILRNNIAVSLLEPGYDSELPAQPHSLRRDGRQRAVHIATDVQPTSRRVLRSVFGSTPYVEGWGMYSQQLMSQGDYLNNSKELRLTWLKQKLPLPQLKNGCASVFNVQREL